MSASHDGHGRVRGCLRAVAVVAALGAAWGCASATQSPVAQASAPVVGPVIVDGAAAEDLRRALGWTEYDVAARELPALPGVAPLSPIEREIAAQAGRTAAFYGGGRLVAHGVDHPLGPGLGRIVLNRFGDMLWLVPPVEAATPGAHLVANPWVRSRLLQAQWDRFKRLPGFAARRGAPRVPVYMSRIPAGDQAAIGARIRAQVAASRAAAKAAERGAAQAGRAAAGQAAMQGTLLTKDSVIEGFKLSNHAFRKGVLGRGATEEIIEVLEASCRLPQEALVRREP